MAPYTPTNLVVYETAMASAQAAITASGRYPTDATPGDYAGPSQVALAIAQSLDTEWGLAGLGVPDTYQVEAIQAAITDAFFGRTPTSTSVASYNPEMAALVAIIIEGRAAFVASGNTPDPWPGGGGGSSTPLTRTKWVDNGTIVPAPSRNGFIGLPYKSIGAAIVAAGIGTSVADNTEAIVYALSAPANVTTSLASYNENVVGTPYRSEEISARNGSTIVTGTYTLHNTVAAGGIPGNVPSNAIKTFTNMFFTGGVTITDDGTCPLEIICNGSNGVLCGFNGGFDTSACTSLGAVVGVNWIFNGYNGLATASGASFDLVTCGVGGTVTCQAIAWISVTYSGTAITVATGSNNSFSNCRFSGATPTMTGAAGPPAAIVMDMSSYLSFLGAGGTFANCTVQVSGISKTKQAPTAVAAGATATFSHDTAVGATALTSGNFALFDMTGAAPVCNAPNNAQNGDVFGAGNGGVGATPGQVNATNGATIEDPGNPGNFSIADGQVQIKNQGQKVWWMFQASTNKWIIIGTA